MKAMRILPVIALATALSVNCGPAREATSNSGPDRTSLPGTPVPSNTMTAANSNANAIGANATSARNSFWAEAAIGAMAEVELGKLALTKAQNAEVKRFAQMMVSDHTKSNDELKALASNKNIELPAAMDAKRQAMVQRIQGLSGAEFDREYVDDMVEDHEADVQAFEKQSQDDTDPDAKMFAAKTLPTLRKHLEAIKAIQTKLK